MMDHMLALDALVEEDSRILEVIGSSSTSVITPFTTTPSFPPGLGGPLEGPVGDRRVPEGVVRNTVKLLAGRGGNIRLGKFLSEYERKFGSNFVARDYGFGCLRLALLSLPGVTLTTDRVWLWSCRSCGMMPDPATGLCKCERV
ncbi:hypothetical protein FOZ63_006105 [Perkinsus olseni]|uniref:Uncharacterized protein n=1 Tax=Perkinsus olseni TaxID=32597 RepID=A0A7J6UJD5_PEROL|nr:hypothetical protein FOZ63_006105 [Perkinsus olseni]